MMTRANRSPVLAAAAVVAMLFGLAACGSSNDDSGSSPEGVQVVGARVDRPANPAVAAVRMEIVNGTDRDDTLTAVSSPDGDASLHRSTTDEQGMAGMDHLQELEISAGGTVELAPGGLHIMLNDPDTTLEVGDEIELTLTFERAGPQKLTVPVVEPGTTADDVESGGS